AEQPVTRAARDERAGANTQRGVAHYEPPRTWHPRPPDAAARSCVGVGAAQLDRSAAIVTATLRYDSPARDVDSPLARPPLMRVMLVDDHPIVRRGLRDILVDAFAGAI